MITGQNLIGFKRSATGDKIFKTFNPKLNIENSNSFHEASNDEINDAVELAWKAFQSYQNFSGERKAGFLNAIADEIEALGQDLIAAYCEESGLPEGRAMGERGRTMFQLRSFAELVKKGDWVDAHIDTAQPDRSPLAKPDIRKMMIPLGPVVVFGASNFPLRQQEEKRPG